MSAKPRVRVRAGGHLGEVIPIKPMSTEEVWIVLNTMFELAEAGHLNGIAVAATLHDGCVSTAYVTGENVFTLMGAIKQVARRVESEVPTG